MKWRVLSVCLLLCEGVSLKTAYAEKIFARDVIAMDKNNEETDLQTILNRLLPTNQGVDLSELKATAAELNILSGISSNVTTENLNTLTGGGLTTLHSHSGNNADTFDNLDSTQFLRSDADDTFEGTTLTIDGDVALASGGTISTTSNGDMTLNPNGSGNILLGTSGNQTIVQIQGDLSVSGDIFSGISASVNEKMRALQQELSNPSQSQVTKSLKEFEETISQMRKRVAFLEEIQIEQRSLPQKNSAVIKEKDENKQIIYSDINKSFKEYLFERGEDRLKNGEATIFLSPQFLEQIEIDENNPLFVKTTLLSSDCDELAIVERGLYYFRVKELHQGTSHCPFLWEASAKKEL